MQTEPQQRAPQGDVPQHGVLTVRAGDHQDHRAGDPAPMAYVELVDHPRLDETEAE